MGNTISFASPRLEGALSVVDGSEVFETSYAFDPSNSNAFGVPATVSVDGIASFRLKKGWPIADLHCTKVTQQPGL